MFLVSHTESQLVAIVNVETMLSYDHVQSATHYGRSSPFVPEPKPGILSVGTRWTHILPQSEYTRTGLPKWKVGAAVRTANREFVCVALR